MLWGRRGACVRTGAVGMRAMCVRVSRTRDCALWVLWDAQCGAVHRALSQCRSRASGPAHSVMLAERSWSAKSSRIYSNWRDKPQPPAIASMHDYYCAGPTCLGHVTSTSCNGMPSRSASRASLAEYYSTFQSDSKQGWHLASVCACMCLYGSERPAQASFEGGPAVARHT